MLVQSEILHFASLAVLDTVGGFVVVFGGFFFFCINPGLAVGDGTFIERYYLKEWQKTCFITNLTEIYIRNVSNSPVH